MFLEFPAGAFTKDSASPPTEDGQGLIFAADGADHIAGSVSYVPALFRAPTYAITLTFSFIPVVMGVAGVARFDLQYYVLDDANVLLTGTHTIYVDIDGASAVATVDLDISSWLTSSSANLLTFIIMRNSGSIGDTLNESIALLNVRTNEI